MTAAPLPAPLPACPFCGADGEALRVLPPTCTPKSPYNPADRAYPVLRCGGCGASVPGEDWDALGASAIAAWNRRAAPAWRAESAPTDVRAWDMPPRVQVSFATMGEALDAVPIIRAAFAPPGATPAAPPAREAALVEALREISESHIPSMPMTAADDELAWAQKHVAHLRRIALKAISGEPT